MDIRRKLSQLVSHDAPQQRDFLPDTPFLTAPAGEIGSSSKQAARAQRQRAPLTAFPWPSAPGIVGYDETRPPTQSRCFGPGAPAALPCRPDVILFEQRLAPGHTHGRAPLADAASANWHRLAQLDCNPHLAEVDLQHVLFLDTETTGLNGGAGTVAFLVGLGFFKNNGFRVEQLLLPEPAREAPFLEHLARRMTADTVLCTYNGKAFDWPLLRNRFVLNRMAVPRFSAHLDLLTWARRIFRFRLETTRLIDVEREILGFLRVGDINGAEIPARYWHFLRTGVDEWLRPIITHNVSDVVALAALVGFFSRSLAERYPTEDNRVRLGLATVAARARDSVRALAWARQAVEMGDLNWSGLAFCAETERRWGDRTRAVSLWKRALRTGHPSARERSQSHLALAKLYEHDERDFRRALEHARRTTLVEGKEACQHRQARLLRRLARATTNLAHPTPSIRVRGRQKQTTNRSGEFH